MINTIVSRDFFFIFVYFFKHVKIGMTYNSKYANKF